MLTRREWVARRRAGRRGCNLPEVNLELVGFQRLSTSEATVDRGLLDRVCREASDLSEPQLRKVLDTIARCRQRANGRGDAGSSPPKSAARKSFRTLTAFGIWSDRKEIKDPVHFTTQLRRRMERGEEST